MANPETSSDCTMPDRTPPDDDPHPRIRKLLEHIEAADLSDYRWSRSLKYFAKRVKKKYLSD